MVESKKIPDPERNKPLVHQQILKAFQTINRWVEVPGVCSFRALLEFSQFVVRIFAESLPVGGFNLSQKKARQNWIISTIFGVKIRNL